MSQSEATSARALWRQRERLRLELGRWLDRPLLWLSFVWLALLVIEAARGLSPVWRGVATVLWGIFIADFFLRLLLSPNKARYLRRNWLYALSLLLPTLRVFRFLRGFRVVRAVSATSAWQTVRLLGSVNRGMRALRRALSRRRVGYVFALTCLIVVAGAAGMYSFEKNVPSPQGLHSYSEALWWTAMLVTTIGSAYWPVTPGGQALCFAISVYSLGVLGYLTAALATFFVGRDAADPSAEIAGERTLRELRREISELRSEIRQLSKRG